MHGTTSLKLVANIIAVNCKLWIVYKVEGSDRDERYLLTGNKWGKPRKTSIMLEMIRIDIRTQNVPVQ